MASARHTVRVCVRTRPTAHFAQDELFIDAPNGSVNVYNKTSTDAVNNKQDTWRFKYQTVLHNSTQDQVYDSVCTDIVGSACNGQSGCIMAYGQTGSGKTFTMLGDPKTFRNRGVFPRALAQVFSHVASKPETEYIVSLSFMELYGATEKIRDLLVISGVAAKAGVPAGQAVALGISVADTGAPRAAGGHAPPTGEFAIVDDPVHGTVVRGLTLVPVASEEEALALMFEAELWRTTADHHLNKGSNRSHSIFTVHVTARSRLGGGREKLLTSKLHLVDLAGSERLKKTMGGEAVDATMQAESVAINKSLSMLETCVAALTSRGTSFVPYRSSKLTNVLKDALGGASNTCLIACIWGEKRHLEETISTLRLAQRMTSVHTSEGQQAVVYDQEELLKKLTREVAQLKLELQMHDSLASRTGVNYGEYTPEQQAALASRLRDFLAANTDDAETQALPLESVAQLKEIMRQMKIMVRAAGVEAEEKLRTKFVLVAKDGSGQQFPMPGGAGAGGAAGGEMLVGEAYAGGGAGAIDEGVSGLGLGLAPRNARPGGEPMLPPSLAGRVQSGRAGRNAQSATSARSLTSARAGGVYPQASISVSVAGPVSPGSGQPSASFRGHASPLLALGTGGVPLDVNVAWKMYKSSPGLGGDASAEIVRLKTAAADRKAELAVVGGQVNSCKARIDEVQRALDLVRSSRERSAARPASARDGSVPSDDEFKLSHELAESKKAYRVVWDKYNLVRAAAEKHAGDATAALSGLLADFETWFAQSTGRLPPVALSPIRTHGRSGGVSLGGRSHGFGAAAAHDWTAAMAIGGGDDLLDEAEAFEKLELDRVAHTAPGSESYFTATKRIRDGARSVGRKAL